MSEPAEPVPVCPAVAAPPLPQNGPCQGKNPAPRCPRRGRVTYENICVAVVKSQFGPPLRSPSVRRERASPGGVENCPGPPHSRTRACREGEGTGVGANRYL